MENTNLRAFIYKTNMYYDVFLAYIEKRLFEFCFSNSIIVE